MFGVKLLHNLSSMVLLEYSALIFCHLKVHPSFSPLGTFKCILILEVYFSQDFYTCLVSETFKIQEEGANVTANALHPGTINTGFGSNVSVVLKGILFLSNRKY